MPHTLLLADDSVTIQRVIELTFADEDVRVIAVSNGDEAIAVLNRTSPDIVLADVGMPVPSGYDIAQYIKDTPQLAHIPVVLLTGAFEPVDQAKAAAVGCDGVLAKPFEPQLVIGRVKELLARPKQAGASRAAPQSPPPEPSALRALSIEDPRSPADFAKAPPPADLGDYFDRLDQAFANFAGPETMKAEAPPVADSWSLHAPPSLPDLPLSYGSSTADVDRVGELGGSPFATPTPLVSPPLGEASPPLGEASPPSGEVSPPFGEAAPAAEVTPPPASSLPPLADAFAALLEAERSAPAPSTAPAWPSGPPPAAVTPDLVEQVTRSVLEGLADSVVRETVRHVVTGVAERLVREEMERIKSNIK